MFIQEYTNPQLTHFEAAVFVVLNGYGNDRNNTNVNYNLGDDSYNSDINRNYNFTYSLGYWASEEIKAQGAAYYSYNPLPGEELNFTLQSSPDLQDYWNSLTGSEEEKVIAICEYHAQNFILNTK